VNRFRVRGNLPGTLEIGSRTLDSRRGDLKAIWNSRTLFDSCLDESFSLPSGVSIARKG